MPLTSASPPPLGVALTDRGTNSAMSAFVWTTRFALDRWNARLDPFNAMSATSILSLPRELLEKIRSHIHSLQAHVNFSLTCRGTYKLYDDQFWRFACITSGWGLRVATTEGASENEAKR